MRCSGFTAHTGCQHDRTGLKITPRWSRGGRELRAWRHSHEVIQRDEGHVTQSPTVPIWTSCCQQVGSSMLGKKKTGNFHVYQQLFSSDWCGKNNINIKIWGKTVQQVVSENTLWTMGNSSIFMMFGRSLEVFCSPLMNNLVCQGPSHDRNEENNLLSQMKEITTCQKLDAKRNSRAVLLSLGSGWWSRFSKTTSSMRKNFFSFDKSKIFQNVLFPLGKFITPNPICTTL